MKTGLVLVDIQNDYFPGGRMELVGISEAGQRAGGLLSFFRDNKWPAFHIQHLSVRKGATFFLPDTRGAEIHACIKPLSDVNPCAHILAVCGREGQMNADSLESVLSIAQNSNQTEDQSKRTPSWASSLSSSVM